MYVERLQSYSYIVSRILFIDEARNIYETKLVDPKTKELSVKLPGHCNQVLMKKSHDQNGKIIFLVFFGFKNSNQVKMKTFKAEE